MGCFELPEGHHGHGDRIKLKPRVKEIANGKHRTYMQDKETCERHADGPLSVEETARDTMSWCPICFAIGQGRELRREQMRQLGRIPYYTRRQGKLEPRSEARAASKCPGISCSARETGVRRCGLDTNDVGPLPMRAAERDLDLVLGVGAVVMGGGHAVQHAVDVVLADGTPRPRRQAQRGRHRQRHMQARRRGPTAVVVVPADGRRSPRRAGHVRSAVAGRIVEIHVARC